MFCVSIKSKAFAYTIVSPYNFVLFCLFYFCHNTKVTSILILCKLVLISCYTVIFVNIPSHLHIRFKIILRIYGLISFQSELFQKNNYICGIHFNETSVSCRIGIRKLRIFYDNQILTGLRPCTYMGMG